MTFVVEISNPERSNGKPYERWKLGSEDALRDRIEAETGWPLGEAEAAAGELATGGDKLEVDVGEKGKRVVAYELEGALV